MKSSLKNIVSLISVAGLSLSVSLPSLAQTSPSTNDPSRAPGPGVVDQPSNGSPSMPMMGDLGQTPHHQASTSAETQDMSIAAIVDEDPSFEMLNALLGVAALEQPAMVSSLSGSKDYTVFAPTNNAFAALPPNAIRVLVQPQNRDLLARLLSYHIVSGDVAMADAPVGTSYPSRNLVGDLPPAGNLNPNAIPGNVDRNQVIQPNSSNPDQRSSMGGFGRSDIQSGANNPAQPPSGDLSPNEPSNTIDRSQVTEPSNSNPDQRGGMSSSNGSSTYPANGSSSSNRPNSNPEIRSEADLNPPSSENRNAGNENTHQSSMNGSGTSDIQSGANNPAQPPSGDLSPNEPSNTVDRSQVTEPSYSNPDQRSTNAPMAQTEGSSMTDSAMMAMPDIQAKNGVIHPIDRVIIPTELQAELQQVIADDSRSASR